MLPSRRVFVDIFAFDCNSCVSVRAQPRGWRGGGEGLVGRLSRTMAGGVGEQGKHATSIGVCASATALLRMMLATGQCHVTYSFFPPVSV